MLPVTSPSEVCEATSGFRNKRASQQQCVEKKNEQHSMKSIAKYRKCGLDRGKNEFHHMSAKCSVEMF